MKTHALEQLES